MNLTSIPIMAALKERMSWLNNNQNVISQNIANADTPNYKAKELEKQDFSSILSNLVTEKGSAGSTTSMRVTNNRHMNTSGAMAGAESQAREVKGGEETLSGNSVILEEQMMKLADNQMKYSMVVNLYKKNVGLLKAAMGKGSGGR
ncbi:flagellar basal body rod protein FlgB [Kordiimonas pumila]|uniref:Flagellar basal body rod protein FlgB n=1 Tax=Kordiimonas pumila TaxID=2161677 RepID=A0ABV7D2E9_9PROT|nr:flagellar basal body rod protein FlgB [Kordiimonas pumila]